MIPEGTAVVQVGDLVHKGSESTECVELAARLIDMNPGRYVQLVGNHEAHYLGGPDVSMRKGVNPIDPIPCEHLRDWWSDGALRLACAVSTPLWDVLVTHGGLTTGFFDEFGSPSTASGAAEAMEAIRAETDRVFRPGALMTGESRLLRQPNRSENRC